MNEAELAKRFPYTIGQLLVSDFQVMKSAAGYYVGRSCWDTEDGYEAPYSRDSEYFSTESKAADSFEYIRMIEEEGDA